ncbi:MAG: DinB family protein [Phycisphaerae bacterium]
MSISQALLAEFEHEAAITKKFLERIPADKLTWKAHPKSHTIGALGNHIAVVPGGVIQGAQHDEVPLPDFETLFRQPTSVDEILANFSNSVETVRQLLPTFTDAKLATAWTGTRDGKPQISMPKGSFLRFVMLNHWIQHRGQLGVYLRLTGAKVPSSYGPSGDEG